MRKIITFALLMFVSLIPQPLSAQNNPVKFTDILPQLENILMDLSSNINQFENILSTMDTSAKANQNYNQQKNIFLSSVLAISTISTICEYERDLMTLFIDLREKNRQKFYDVRIESLETAVRQINTMQKQIQINYTILPPNFFESPLVRKERITIQSTIDLMNQIIELLRSVSRGQ
ncbi:MAG: hypothetical protein JSV83_12440 [Desulfobacterales bacterium]|nr:MAG: hypothetical protein JSV83_12440 [Desulfobacterales bacterium]